MNKEHFAIMRERFNCLAMRGNTIARQYNARVSNSIKNEG